jgi:hypothetical protein
LLTFPRNQVAQDDNLHVSLIFSDFLISYAHLNVGQTSKNPGESLKTPQGIS